MTRRLVILSLTALCIVAIAWQIHRMHSPTPAQKVDIEHEKLQALLTDLEIIERALHLRLDEINKAGQGVTVGNLYQRIDLSSLEAIPGARQRVELFNTQNENFSAAEEESWAAIDRQVKANELDEPFATRLKENWSTAQTDVIPKYRAWFAAGREDVAAVTQLLDVAVRHHGQFTWVAYRPISLDPKASADLQSAQNSADNAERGYNEASRSALGSHITVWTVVMSAMRDLEKGMTRQENAYEESDVETKPQ